ncbi:helix-turn-helix domain-containing protein [Paenibacillus massiliensis]|uniref:helix-turn-helix domain-containing protein n=1 Tax=Paenibacillus massiliensis TaxID=225917 RepID=UPI00048D2593|nr:helix-turn-helix transcriptional regulator [Paenibacillus massiliensis]
MTITVKAARVMAKLTQQQVADKLGLSLTGYKRKESGISKFYVDEIVTISEIFNVPVEIFFEVKCHKKTQTTSL